ncbi:MAG TPA: biotin/lipoyl-containing protein, partial [Flavisolibacter sp.]|nr:biotin/lipoyl-containing protein [Flavisolibacter sp.]
MATVDLVMPKMGESIMEATILKWHKGPGDTIKTDETLLEIATDKVDSEVPSTTEGVIEELLFNVNDVVPIGTVIARIKTGAATGNQQASGNRPQAPEQSFPSHGAQQEHGSVQQQQPATPMQAAPAQQTTSQESAVNRFYSPLVLNIAAQEGVSMSELENITGTGAEGRVSKKD